MADPESKGPDDIFAAVFESAPDAMVISGQDGRIRFVNAQLEALFGYPRQELMGQPIEMLLPARFRDTHVTARETYAAAPRATGLHRNVELYASRKDGTEFPVDVSLSPFQTAAGLLVASAIRDLTERKQLEAGVLEASRLKGEFLANMSHELRTPLNAIIGFAELMHSGKVGSMSEQHREYLGDILSSSRHLLHLINDVLDLTRIESGRMQFAYEPVDLTEVLDEVLDGLRELVENKLLAVERHVDPALGEVVADPGKVTQILNNYLSNAMKFTPRGGRVRASIVGDGPDAFRIDVEDTGSGITSDLVPHLFKDFQQLDAGTAKRCQGTGLGLALTRRLVEGHGGRVSVRTAPGQGSTFSAVLPRRPPDRPPLDAL